MKIEKRLTSTITTLAVMSVILVAAGGVPAILSIRSINDQMLAENRQIENAYALRRLTSNTEALVATSHQRIAAMGSMAIVEGDELSFISDLENAAAETNITQNLQLETVNQTDLGRWEKEIPLKLSAEGEYRHLIVYLHKLETLPYYLNMKTLKISVPKQREKAGQGMAEIYLEATVRWRAKDHPVFKTAGTQTEIN